LLDIDYILITYYYYAINKITHSPYFSHSLGDRGPIPVDVGINIIITFPDNPEEPHIIITTLIPIIAREKQEYREISFIWLNSI
jgi:hypothetical protein